MLLAFDLDNTILTRGGVLPEPIRTAIQAARGAGHEVTILTGRPWMATRATVEALDLTGGPFAVNHGAHLFAAVGEPLWHRRLTGAALKALLSPPLRPPGLAATCLVDDLLLYADGTDPRGSWSHLEARQVRRLQLERLTAADKVVYGADAGNRERRLAMQRDHGVTGYLWGDDQLEVTAAGADKGTALAAIAERLGVPRERTVAFGDGTNDVAMLSWAGTAVAVGDADPAVLQVADQRVAAPERGGVADWLQAHAS